MKIYRTSLNTEEKWKEIGHDPLASGKDGTIAVDHLMQLQEIIGFGGAFTESSSYNLSRVNQLVRRQAIACYFDPEKGLGYTIGRVSIHGCDFSLSSYLYIKDHDDSLASFDISRDEPTLMLIKDAGSIAKKDISLLASPWTPPYWMKTNYSPIHGGHLMPEYYQVWANYFVKFIKSYRKKGLRVDYVTVQNEPEASQRWDSCLFTPKEERDFAGVLGETFEENDLSDVKILICDHNRDIMVKRADVVYSDANTSRYVWGTAFHWYDNEVFENVAIHKSKYPDKHLFFTEGCQENGPHFGDLAVGERYGRNMINDFRNGNEGFLDWNLYLDDTGGPNHVNNLCSAPIILKIFAEEIELMPAYYYIGHFSRYVKPGARVLETSGTETVWHVAFMNPNGEIVVIIQNEAESEKDINVLVGSHKENVKLLPHSIITAIFPAK